MIAPKTGPIECGPANVYLPVSAFEEAAADAAQAAASVGSSLKIANSVVLSSGSLMPLGSAETPVQPVPAPAKRPPEAKVRPARELTVIDGTVLEL